MTSLEKFLPQIDHYLRRAEALKVPKRALKSQETFELRWPRYWTLDRIHLALTLSLIEDFYYLELSITDGGYGCFKLTISIEGLDAEAAARISRKILTDSTFQRLLKDAGAVKISRDYKREQVLCEEAALLDSLKNDDERKMLNKAIELAEIQCGLSLNETISPSERIAKISKMVDELKEAKSEKAEAAQKSAWWLGDVVGGIIGGMTKSLGQ